MWRFGMVIYGLDRLYKAVKKVAVESGEWPRYVLPAWDLRCFLQDKLFWYVIESCVQHLRWLNTRH